MLEALRDNMKIGHGSKPRAEIKINGKQNVHAR